MLGLIGKKIGMTRVFTDAGASTPVTVVEATPNRVTQVKSVAGDGYDAVQVTVGTRRAGRVTKAMQGHFAKAGAAAGRRVVEFRLAEAFVAPGVGGDGADGNDGDANGDTTVANGKTTVADGDTTVANGKTTVANGNNGDATATTAAELTVTMFTAGQKVDVTGNTIGKGFAGVMKRHGFRGGRATHGNSKAHRSGGSIGNAQDPGRIFKGKKMAGRMGGRRRVQQGLTVVRVDAERNLLLISGAIPGARGSDVVVKPSVKARGSR